MLHKPGRSNLAFNDSTGFADPVNSLLATLTTEWPECPIFVIISRKGNGKVDEGKSSPADSKITQAHSS